MAANTPNTISQTVFMRAYALAIKDTFQLDPGEHHCIMVCPATQAGIAAGDLIPPEVTNYLVYKFANALQYSDSPSYNGGSAGDYIQQLTRSAIFTSSDCPLHPYDSSKLPQLD
jgi:hypothetical protein